MSWLIEFDVKGLFDNIDHELMMKAVRWNTESKWLILYIERVLKVPIKLPSGILQERISGTPQGGVISSVLANLYMYYAFDHWMEKKKPQNPWARYADDGVVHCWRKLEASTEGLKIMYNKVCEAVSKKRRIRKKLKITPNFNKKCLQLKN